MSSDALAASPASGIADGLLGGAAAGVAVVRASGVESEIELPFAGLHQLCAPCSAG
jgi:hypothetical protein